MRAKVRVVLNEQERELLDAFSKAVGQNWEQVARFMVVWGLNQHVAKAQEIKDARETEEAGNQEGATTDGRTTNSAGAAE